MLIEAAEADAQPAADVGERRDRGRGPGLRLAQDGVDPGSAGVGGVPGEGEEHAFADLGLPAADGPAPAWPARRG